MKKILAVALVSAACSTALAWAAETTFSIDPNHTHATFAFQHLGFSTFHGKLPARTGTIVLDRAAKTGRVDVEFDTRGAKQFRPSRRRRRKDQAHVGSATHY